MDYEQEKRKQIATDQFEQAEARESYSAPTRSVLTGSDISRRPIRQRIDDALSQANSAIRRAEAAEHARQIIERHPEFADLLDALNEF